MLNYRNLSLRLLVGATLIVTNLTQVFSRIELGGNGVRDDLPIQFPETGTINRFAKVNQEEHEFKSLHSGALMSGAVPEEKTNEIHEPVNHNSLEPIVFPDLNDGLEKEEYDSEERDVGESMQYLDLVQNLMQNGSENVPYDLWEVPKSERRYYDFYTRNNTQNPIDTRGDMSLTTRASTYSRRCRSNLQRYFSQMPAMLMNMICTPTIESVYETNDPCYDHLGCFSMSPPWSTSRRRYPAPQAPRVVGTRMSLFTRRQPARYDTRLTPGITLAGSDYDGRRPTFFITHGFLQHRNLDFLNDMKSAFLTRYDGNVFIVDWRGAWTIDYQQAASNTRIVGAEIARLTKYLIETQGASPSRIHLVGFSLGAHIMSYAAKAIPGIARLTALDPAQPGFENQSSIVRLDKTDALFVEVIHTNAIPFHLTGGWGMIFPHGHVDFYLNEASNQPGCVVPPVDIFSRIDIELRDSRLDKLLDFASCAHNRAHAYFIDSITNTYCTYWGRRYEDSLRDTPCTADSCSPLGIDAINYQARGEFIVQTNSFQPYCRKYVSGDVIMPQHRSPVNNDIAPSLL